MTTQEGILIVGRTCESADMRHAVPTVTWDTLAYLEQPTGEASLFVDGTMGQDAEQLKELTGLDVVYLEDLGRLRSISAGKSHTDALVEVLRDACKNGNLTAVATPGAFPLAIADGLRDEGLVVRSDPAMFEERRRRKTPAEREGVVRAHTAAAAGLEAQRQLLRDAATPPSIEQLREVAVRAIEDAGSSFFSTPEEAIWIGCGDPGGKPRLTGPVKPGQPIMIDIFPRDPPTGCWGDIGRTLCYGEPCADLVWRHELCLQILNAVVARIRPGVKVSELFQLASQIFEDRDIPTLASTLERLEQGARFGLGHGIGIDLHEQPFLWNDHRPLIEGELLAVEPTLLYPDGTGCFVEDVVEVTPSGCDVISPISYELR